MAPTCETQSGTAEERSAPRRVVEHEGAHPNDFRGVCQTPWNEHLQNFIAAAVRSTFRRPMHSSC